MVQHLIVPIDGSEDSWRGFVAAQALAERSNADVRIVQFHFDPVDGRNAAPLLQAEFERRATGRVSVTTEVRLTVGSVASELETLVVQNPGAVLVMSSHGRGRSAAMLGSVTDDVLQRTFGPIILVGPKVQPSDFSGPVIVSVDGSDESEAALPLAAAWAIELGSEPWIVHVGSPASELTAELAHGDLVDSGYPARLAAGLHALTGRPVEYDELHDRHPDRAVASYATQRGASLIVASSHGRSGRSRLALGSVTSGFVRDATCPVVVVRLPRPAHG